MVVCVVVGINGGINESLTGPFICFTVGDSPGFYTECSARLNHLIKAEHMWFGYRSFSLVS